MTAHDFRTLASTLLNEKGWHPDLIELQLAHNERNNVRGSNILAHRLAERRVVGARFRFFGKSIKYLTDTVLLERTATRSAPMSRSSGSSGKFLTVTAAIASIP
ncbi:MAG TPA: hypothetical protein VHX52_10195 [Steroidobacteraceae bacterium]|jgi:hypothetical protein|nr:hypothetical protein [Steroidobacteraceae bacterium]